MKQSEFDKSIRMSMLDCVQIMWKLFSELNPDKNRNEQFQLAMTNHNILLSKLATISFNVSELIDRYEAVKSN